MLRPLGDSQGVRLEEKLARLGRVIHDLFKGSGQVTLKSILRRHPDKAFQFSAT